MDKAWLYIYYPLMEIKRKIFSIKYLSAMMLIVFIGILYTVTIRKFSYLTGYNITPCFFPFLISINFYNLIYFALYIYLFSDAPFVQHNTVYQIIRCGRVKWGIIQLEKIFLSSCFFNIISFILSAVILIPHVSFEDGWGKVIYTLSRTDAGTSYNISINFPYDVVGKYTPLQVLKLTMLILWLAGSCIGLLMFALSLWWGRVVALIGASIWVILTIILDNYTGVWRPLATHFSPISWTRISEIGQFRYGIPRLPSLKFILSAYIILCVIFSLAALFKLRTVDLKWSNEE